MEQKEKLIEIYNKSCEEFKKEFYEGERNSIHCKKHKFFATSFEIQHHNLTHTIKLLEGIVEDMEGRKVSKEQVGIAPADNAVGSENRAFGCNNALTLSLIPIKELLVKLKEKI